VEPNWQLVRKRETLERRARIIHQIRAFFMIQSFLEVETPQRIPANAPELFIDAVPSAEWFLQTSPELCMKRLLSAGYEQLFQICHCWRSGERGRRHLPEYTMLEWYRSHCDYHQLMADCEDLLTTLVPEGQLLWNNITIDLATPWPRITVKDAFTNYSSISLDDALESDQFDAIITEIIEPSLPRNKPIFLYDYPLEHASLARKKPDHENTAERVELYIGGMELANGFSELNDPAEQRLRFQIEEDLRRQQGKTPYPSPIPFLDELEQLPDCAGIALGIDRLIMLLCDKKTIDDVVLFTPENL